MSGTDMVLSGFNGAPIVMVRLIYSQCSEVYSQPLTADNVK